jgi:hypothetical protein
MWDWAWGGFTSIASIFPGVAVDPGPPPDPGVSTYLQPAPEDGFTYLQPDETSRFLRP